MILLPAETQLDAESCEQSWQEAIYHIQQFQQEARDLGQSQLTETKYDGQSPQEVKTFTGD